MVVAESDSNYSLPDMDARNGKRQHERRTQALVSHYVHLQESMSLRAHFQLLVALRRDAEEKNISNEPEQEQGEYQGARTDVPVVCQLSVPLGSTASSGEQPRASGYKLLRSATVLDVKHAAGHARRRWLCQLENMTYTAMTAVACSRHAAFFTSADLQPKIGQKITQGMKRAKKLPRMPRCRR